MHIFSYVYLILTFREAQSPRSSPITRQKNIQYIYRHTYI